MVRRPFVTTSLVAAALSLGLVACTEAAREASEMGEGAEVFDSVAEVAQGLSTPACTLNGGTTPCTGAISVNPVGNGMFTAKVDMSGYRRLDMFAVVCNPTGWALHLTDSPTADGYGGDGSSTDHDAEAYLLNSGFQFFSTFDNARNRFGTTVSAPSQIPTTGCTTVRMVAFHEAGSPSSTFSYQPSTTAAATTISSLHGMKLGYAACTATTQPTQRGVECDVEDAMLKDQNLWYIGMNRMYGSAARTGTGIKQICVVRSTLVTDVPAVPTACL